MGSAGGPTTGPAGELYRRRGGSTRRDRRLGLGVLCFEDSYSIQFSILIPSNGSKCSTFAVTTMQS